MRGPDTPREIIFNIISFLHKIAANESYCPRLLLAASMSASSLFFNSTFLLPVDSQRAASFCHLFSSPRILACVSLRIWRMFVMALMVVIVKMPRMYMK